MCIGPSVHPNTAGLVLLLLLTARALSAAVTAEIKGRVTNNLTPQQYRAVTVIITDRLGTELGRTHPDKRGRFAIKIGGPRYVIIKAILEGYPEVIYQLDTEEHRESTTEFEHNEVFGELRIHTYYQNITFGAAGSAATTSGPATLEELLAGEDPKAVRAYRKARWHREAGDPDKAIASLQELVRDHPNFYIGLIELGMLLAARQENDRAIEIFTAARQLRPEHPWAYVGLGVALNNKQDYRQAASYLEKAVELEPDSINAQFQLGQAAFRLNQPDRALSCFSRVIELNPTFNPMAYKIMASIYANQQEPFKAAEALELYLKHFPDAPDAAKVKEILTRLRPAH